MLARKNPYVVSATYASAYLPWCWTVASEIRRWSGRGRPARESKRMVRLVTGAVSLLSAGSVPARVRAWGGAARTLIFDRPLTLGEIRNAKPEMRAEIDLLLKEHCVREVPPILN